MPTTRSTRKSGDRDLVAKLADAGEEALQRLAELPGGNRVLSGFNELKGRVDELARKVRGIEELEARVQKLEKELASLKRSGQPRATTRSSSSSRRSTSSSSRKTT